MLSNDRFETVANCTEGGAEGSMVSEEVLFSVLMLHDGTEPFKRIG